MDGEPAAGFGLYLHWPYCRAKCPYCDFNSHVAAGIDQHRWLAAYRSEIARLAAETGSRTLSTVFIGGGTPSLMAPELVAGLLEAVRAAWPMSNDPEITLEANPTSVESSRFRAYRDAGVNRVSVGLQALDDDALRLLGRQHCASEGRAAFALARQVFPRASFDLIYARQHQTAAAWRAELAAALALEPDHLSLYQLTIEDGTPFAARVAAGRMSGLPDDDRAAEMWDITQELCGAAGLPAYEISNHARPGHACRHNLIYWECGDFAGIGPGAHGRLTLNGSRLATEGHRDPAKWLQEVEARGNGESRRAALAPTEAAEERVLMGLRLADGIAIGRGSGPAGAINFGRADALEALGLLERAGDRLRVTPQGRLLLDRIIIELLAA
ncbi:MAG: coproporphyrinogen III oxidase [Rhodobacteraceae bacterium]|jgi:oxygen-independent coproporphyrinogen-3 oxidase|nr:coproporphyrinogen III oxidase [Paracoccaceae bacterium]